MAYLKKKLDGTLIIKVTADRKFNILSKKVESSTKTVDYNQLIEYFAKEYMKIQKKKIN